MKLEAYRGSEGSYRSLWMPTCGPVCMSPKDLKFSLDTGTLSPLQYSQ